MSESEAEELVEELRKAKVEDVLLPMTSMLASLAYGKLDPNVRDLEQARIAIDALKALLAFLPENRDLHQVVSNLQLAYVDAAK